jgi:hypothetical protein
MKNKIFINRYSRIQEKVDECIPRASQITTLQQDCAIIELPTSSERKSVIEACRSVIREEYLTYIQPVNNYKEIGNTIEVALPGIKRFFQKNSI